MLYIKILLLCNIVPIPYTNPIMHAGRVKVVKSVYSFVQTYSNVLLASRDMQTRIVKVS